MPAGFKMVSFLQSYTEAINLQIEAIQQNIDSSMTTVMNSLQELSVSTEKNKEEADKTLEATYLNPDAQTSEMVTSIQDSTDDIFEQAQRAMEQTGSVSSVEQIKDNSDDVRRMGGLFSKHMESISTLDDSLKDLVMTMVGSLSNADVIKQRLDHVTSMLKAMNLGLGNVIVDLDGRLTDHVFSSFKDNLLELTYKSYTVEEEKDAFKAIFGPPPHIVRAYSKKAS